MKLPYRTKESLARQDWKDGKEVSVIAATRGMSEAAVFEAIRKK